MMEVLRALLFLPPGGSEVADRIDALHFFVIGMTMLGAVVVAMAVVWFVARHRQGQTPRTTMRITPSTGLEVSMWGGLLALFLLFWVLGYRQYLHVRTSPPGAQEIYVSAKQWMWKFSYPDGRSSAGYLVVPEGQPTKLLLTSRDVVHSFFVPEFRVKQDAVPGRYTSLWFEPREPGTYTVFCAEYCGTSHSMMRAVVVVLGAEDYGRWLEGVTPEPLGEALSQAHLDEPVAEPGSERVRDLVAQGREVAVRNACFSCHTIDGQRHVGPTWRELFGKRVRLSSGRTIVADENYLTRSMMEPQVDLVEGYDPVMPTYQGTLTAPDVAALVAYIKSLRGDGLVPAVELPKTTAIVDRVSDPEQRNEAGLGSAGGAP